MGQFFYAITLDQHVIHKRTRVIDLKSQLSRFLEPTTYHPPGGSHMDSQSKLRRNCEKVMGVLSFI